MQRLRENQQPSPLHPQTQDAGPTGQDEVSRWGWGAADTTGQDEGELQAPQGWTR